MLRRHHSCEDAAARTVLLALAAVIFANSVTQPLTSPDSISVFAIAHNRGCAVLIAVVWAAAIVVVSICTSPEWRRRGGQVAISLCVANGFAAILQYGLESPFLRLAVLWLLASLVIGEVAAQPACEERRVKGRRRWAR